MWPCGRPKRAAPSPGRRWRCCRRGPPPYPFLVAEVFASSIGGRATLIGDPPNIITGSAAHLSFNDFVFALTPVIILVMAAQLLATHLIWGREMRATPAGRARVMALH